MKWWSLFFVVACLALPISGSIIKKPPTKSTETPYKDLVCTDEDRANVYEIISTMSENGKLSLLFKQSHLKEVGSRINHLHPLKFLSAIFTDPHLKSCMYYIWNDYFKKGGFLDGLGPSLTREAERGKLEQYLDDFSAEVGVKGENIRPYFNSHDWEGLVLYLIQS